MLTCTIYIILCIDIYLFVLYYIIDFKISRQIVNSTTMVFNNNSKSFFTYSKYQIVLLLLLFIICSNELKHPNTKSKSKTQQHKIADKGTSTPSSTPVSTAASSPSTSISASSPSTSVDTSQANSEKSETLVKPDLIDPIQVMPAAAKIIGMGETHSFLIEASANQYTIPITIANNKYNLGIVYDQKSSKYGDIPSWFFTNSTEMSEGHQLCDRNDDCQNITKLIQCEPKNSKIQNPPCIEQGKAKYNEETIKSKKQFKIQFVNNNLKYQSVFVSPTKIVLTDNKIGEEEIEGMINIALNNEQEYANSIILNRNNLTVLSQKDLESYIGKDDVIELSKGGLLGLSSQKDIFIRTEHAKSNKQTNNVKGSYKKIHLHFSQSKDVLALPKNLLTAVKNILKKQYFGDRCKINDDQIVCSADPVKNITQIKLCRDKGGKKCVNLNILGRIIKQEKAGRKYTMLIKQNKGSGEEETIIFYPKLAEAYEIYAEKGTVKAVKYLNDTKEEQEMVPKSNHQNKEQKSQKQQSQKISKQSQEKQSEKEQQSKSNKKEQNSQGKQEQQNKNDKQEQEQDEEQKEKKPKKKQKSKRSKHTSSSQSISSPVSNPQQGAIEQEQTYSKKRLFFVFLYCSAFVILLIAIKVEAKQSFAATLIDRFLQVTWYRMVNNFFQKNNQGYNPPSLQEDEGHQQLDRSDSVAVGIKGKQGKELFWQKNSIEGF